MGEVCVSFHVVVVFDIGQHVDLEMTGDHAMDDGVIGLGIPAHELHRLPVFLTFVGVQIQPGQMSERADQFRMQRHR